MTYLGLTWDHPRGYDALAEAARRVSAGRSEPIVCWEKQPLEGFESAPIADLAARHDLLVLDHPHIGEAVADDCLIPLEELYDSDQLAQWRENSIGPSLASYHWQGNTYAVPLDVATQVMARRSDKVGAPPATWDEVEEISETRTVALSLGGPHAFLNLISFAACAGHVIDGDTMLPDSAALPALEMFQRLYDRKPTGSESLNPIQLLESMSRSEDIALVPLIFGYVTYSQKGYAPHLVHFSDTIMSPGGYGGVLGGTGIAISRRAAPTQDLLDHIAWLMDTRTQTEFFPIHGGQPSARAAWADITVNTASNNFYAETARTAETALLRPRFDGYIAFQTRASDVLRAAFAGRQDPERTLNHLRALWRDARQSARGGLDDNRMNQ